MSWESLGDDSIDNCNGVLTPRPGDKKAKPLALRGTRPSLDRFERRNDRAEYVGGALPRCFIVKGVKILSIMSCLVKKETLYIRMKPQIGRASGRERV